MQPTVQRACLYNINLKLTSVMDTQTMGTYLRKELSIPECYWNSKLAHFLTYAARADRMELSIALSYGSKKVAVHS